MVQIGSPAEYDNYLLNTLIGDLFYYDLKDFLCFLDYQFVEYTFTCQGEHILYQGLLIATVQIVLSQGLTNCLGNSTKVEFKGFLPNTF